MNKIIFKMVLMLLSLVKEYPYGSYEDFGLSRSIVLIKSLYGLEKRMNIQDMDNLLQTIDSNWNVEKNFGTIIDNIIRNPNRKITSRYSPILRDMFTVYGRKRIKELREKEGINE